MRNHELINNHNKKLVELTHSNMDISYIEGGYATACYACKYVTKPEEKTDKFVKL